LSRSQYHLFLVKGDSVYSIIILKNDQFVHHQISYSELWTACMLLQYDILSATNVVISSQNVEKKIGGVRGSVSDPLEKLGVSSASTLDPLICWGVCKSPAPGPLSAKGAGRRNKEQ